MPSNQNKKKSAKAKPVKKEPVKKDTKPAKASGAGKASKVSKATKKTPAPVPAPAPVAAPAPAPVAVPVPAPVPVVTVSAPIESPASSDPVVISDGDTDTESNVEYRIKSIQELESVHLELTKLINSQTKSIQKIYNKELTKLKKKKTRKDPDRVTRKPSGFAVPQLITDDLCKFMEVPSGSKVARTEVTKKVTVHIKLHHLNKEDNRRFFTPDAVLQNLLGPLDNIVKNKKDGKTDAEKGYSYFNLQKYISPQFIKSVPVVA